MSKSDTYRLVDEEGWDHELVRGTLSDVLNMAEMLQFADVYWRIDCPDGRKVRSLWAARELLNEIQE
jgi:hypothetical protein